MKKSRFSEQQIAFILKQAEDGTTVEEVCRKAGISIQTYYRWRSKYVGLMPSEMKRLKVLEEENVRLKRLVANLSLDKEMLAKTSSAEKCRAWSSPGDRRLFAGELPGQRTASLQRVSDQSIDPALSVAPPRSGRPQDADQGVGCDPYSLRIPTHPCTAAA